MVSMAASCKHKAWGKKKFTMTITAYMCCCCKLLANCLGDIIPWNKHKTNPSGFSKKICTCRKHCWASSTSFINNFAQLKYWYCQSVWGQDGVRLHNDRKNCKTIETWYLYILNSALTFKYVSLLYKIIFLKYIHSNLM